ncbi:FAS-associated factor 1-like [Saccostrea cucullata]|uniref:FAS-associated factor 1-like n=1 Tax=Saccostrea cuccullata TaxID=36930 RepID=UPI002ED0E092
MENLTEALDRKYALHINFTVNGEVQHYKLNKFGSETIGEVKNHMYAITNVPQRQQIWAGWPDSAKNEDSMLIGCCGLNYPIHYLELTVANITRSKKVPSHRAVDSVLLESDGGLSPTGEESLPSDFEDIIPLPNSAFSSDDDSNITDSRAFFDPSSASGCDEVIRYTSSLSLGRRHPGGGQRPRMLNFKVEYRDRNYYFSVGDNEKIGTIKDLLSQKTGVSPEKQILRGWNTQKIRVGDDKILRDLYLPKENTLFLSTSDSSNPIFDKPAVQIGIENLTEALNRKYALHINFTENGEVQRYKLNKFGSETIGEVKSHMYAITSVPERQQIWTGWPDSAKNEDSYRLD